MAWPGVDLSQNSFERARDFMAAMASDPDFQGHDRDLFRKHATLRSAALPPEVQYPTVVVRLKIDPSMANRVGNLHGGCTATIFDDITTVPLTLVAREGAWQMAGVTRSLSVTYLKGVPVGEEVDVVAEVLNAGGRLACIRGTMKRVSDGEVLAIAVHDKANTDPPASKM